MFNWLNISHSLRLQTWRLALTMLLWEHIIQTDSWCLFAIAKAKPGLSQVPASGNFYVGLSLISWVNSMWCSAQLRSQRWGQWPGTRWPGFKSLFSGFSLPFWASLFSTTKPKYHIRLSPSCLPSNISWFHIKSSHYIKQAQDDNGQVLTSFFSLYWLWRLCWREIMILWNGDRRTRRLCFWSVCYKQDLWIQPQWRMQISLLCGPQFSWGK